MLHGSPSPGVAGSELTRLLACFAGNPPADVRPAFAERLGHWLKWTDAALLSAALNNSPAAAAPSRAAALGAEQADFQRVRATLEASIAAGPREATAGAIDFGPYRRHCIDQQQAMDAAIGALRQRLREALSRRSSELARLAAIDAVMDQTLAARERGLLGLVPLPGLTKRRQLERELCLRT